MTNIIRTTAELASADAMTTAYTAYKAAEANVTAAAGSLKALQAARAEMTAPAAKTADGKAKAKTQIAEEAAVHAKAKATADTAISEADAHKAKTEKALKVAGTEYTGKRNATPAAALLLDARNALQDMEAAQDRALSNLAEIQAQHAEMNAETPALAQAHATTAAAMQVTSDNLASAHKQMTLDRATRDADLKEISEANHAAAVTAHDEAKALEKEAGRNLENHRATLEGFSNPRKSKTGTPGTTEGSLTRAEGVLNEINAKVSTLEGDVITAEHATVKEYQIQQQTVVILAQLKAERPGLSAASVKFAELLASVTGEGNTDQEKVNRYISGALMAAVNEIYWLAQKMNPNQRSITAEFVVGVGSVHSADPRNVSQEELPERAKKEVVASGKLRNRAAFGRTEDDKVVKAAQYQPDAERTYVGLKLTTKFRRTQEAKLGSVASTRGDYEIARELVKREAHTVEAAPTGRIKRSALTVDAEAIITDTAPLDLVAAEATATQNEGHAAD